MINEAVMLLGGLGTRLLPYTKVVSKEMLPIYDNPMIYYLVKELYEAGIKRIIMVVNENNEPLIKKYFTRNMEYENKLSNDKKTLLNDLNNLIDNIEFVYVRQIIKGTYGALYSVKDHLKSDNFLVLYGDDYLPDSNTSKMLIDNYLKTGKMQVIIKEESNLPQAGIVKIDKNNYLENLNKINQDHSSCIFLGRMLLNKKIFLIKDSVTLHDDGEYYLPYALLKFQGEVLTIKYRGKYFNLGEKNGYIKATIYYISNYKKDININDIFN